jgi:GntR family transcriptional regulator / MocR family aminotransferase
MPESRTNSSRAAELLIDLDHNSGEPLHRQIAMSVRDQIRAGRLRQGSCLPPTRRLAASLAVSRGVVVEAYQQLTAEGYLVSRAGGYTTVAVTAWPAPAPAPSPRPAPGPRVSFGYGIADAAQFPRSAWLRSISRTLTLAPADRFTYLTGHGVPELRHAMADYLNRVRGTAANADNIVICSGFSQGVVLVIQAMAALGVRRLAVEDPSAYQHVRSAAAAAGLELAAIPVGDDGIDVGLLEQSGADAVIVTPSHQWPTGSVLGPGPRANLLTWAGRRNSLIVEDDYDAEYRYDRAPVGALHGLEPARVIYAGSASKTLAPGLRLGWLILPSHLVEPVAEAKLAADRGSPVIDQLAFADFLTRGEFDRHLRRMRPAYRRRRDALLAALRGQLPDLQPAGISAGFHLIAWLPPGLDEPAVIEAAARRGLGIEGLAPYRITPGRPGLIFSYAGLTEQSITEGVHILAQAITELRPAAGRRWLCDGSAGRRRAADRTTPAGSTGARHAPG